MFQEHQMMVQKSNNPHWYYGPELMALVANMVGCFAEDTMGGAYYERWDLFRPTVEAIEDCGSIFDDKFLKSSKPTGMNIRK
jgi:hypothetical protein